MKNSKTKNKVFIHRFQELGTRNIMIYFFLLAACTVAMFSYLGSMGISYICVFTCFGISNLPVLETQICVIALVAYVVCCIYVFARKEK